jgi:hypothetical protein
MSFVAYVIEQSSTSTLLSVAVGVAWSIENEMPSRSIAWLESP